MEQLDLTPGTSEWLAFRARPGAHNASDAPAMLGCSPYVKRTDLLRRAKTGEREVIDDRTQERFDMGHRIEAEQRLYAESILGEPLYVVIGLNVVDGVEITASFDGLPMFNDRPFECKTLNDAIREALPTPRRAGLESNDARRLAKYLRVQMEQQLAVCGGTRVLFIAATADNADSRCCWYLPDIELRREIIEGWRQWDADVAAFEDTPAAEVVIATPRPQLPAVSVRMDGSLKVVSNLELFEVELRRYVAAVPKKPTTDQEFADAFECVKTLKAAEEALQAAESVALASLENVDRLRRKVTELLDISSTARKLADNAVKTRKAEIRRLEIVRGETALAKYFAELNAQLGGEFMPPPTHAFSSAIANLKTMDSLRNAIDTHLADLKRNAGLFASNIRKNIDVLNANAGFDFLFADKKALLLKSPDDFALVVRARIEEHRNKPAATSAPAAATPAPVASPAVVSMRPAAAPAGPPTLRLGAINERIAPLAITVEGLRKFGFEPAGRDRSAILYHEADYLRMLAALIRHLEAGAFKPQEDDEDRVGAGVGA